MISCRNRIKKNHFCGVCEKCPEKCSCTVNSHIVACRASISTAIGQKMNVWWHTHMCSLLHPLPFAFPFLQRFSCAVYTFKKGTSSCSQCCFCFSCLPNAYKNQCKREAKKSNHMHRTNLLDPRYSKVSNEGNLLFSRRVHLITCAQISWIVWGTPLCKRLTSNWRRNAELRGCWETFVDAFEKSLQKWEKDSQLKSALTRRNYTLDSANSCQKALRGTANLEFAISANSC